MKMTVWLILQFSENCPQVCLLLWAFQDFQFSLIISLAFSGGKEGHTSQHPDVLAGLRRPNIRREFFLLSALNLNNIPYNSDSRETLDRVHVKYIVPKGALMSKTVATFVRKEGLI